MAKSTKAKVDDYRSLDNEGLANKISDDELRLKKVKFSHAVNPVENPQIIRQMRSELARLKTENRRRQLGF